MLNHVHDMRARVPAHNDQGFSGVAQRLDGAGNVRALAAREQHEGIGIMGSTEAARLSIISFTLQSPRGSFLHYNFVVAVLNDLFGIQSRGGCSCAGPYGHRLLGIDLDASKNFVPGDWVAAVVARGVCSAEARGKTLTTRRKKGWQKSLAQSPARREWVRARVISAEVE